MNIAVSEHPPQPGAPLSRTRLVQNRSILISGAKAGRDPVWVESELEADAWYMFEGNADVVSLTPQSIQVALNRSASRTSTLDLGVRYRDGTETHYEVKPEEKLEDNEAGVKAPKNWDVIERYAKRHALNVDFITDKTLKAARYTIQNWRTLLPLVCHARDDPHPDIAFEILPIVTALRSPTTSEVLRHLPYGSQDQAINEVAMLLHQGKLSSGLDKRRWCYNSPLICTGQ